ncbi:hypothetical protein AYO39_03015 [Actinobacteria bacterium SCGC AG-212-D09]|nr:hypothetical protein AYO39_03015 [Actinobacteria bacterium SCGC AG-212-D09]
MKQGCSRFRVHANRPVVAGIAAVYLSHHVSTPAATAAWIIDHATTGVILNNPAGTAIRLVDKADL